MKKLRKIIVITPLFLLLVTFVNAQQGTTENRERFQVGLKVGGTYSSVYDAKGEEFIATPKFGFTGGTFIMIPVGKFLGLQPEVLITQKGFKGSGRLLGDTYSFKKTTTFLEIPLFFTVKPSEFITILIGPQYSFLLHQRDKFTSSVVNFDQEHSFEQDNIRKNIFGFVGGVDVNIKNLVLGARIGMDVMNNRGDGTSNTPRYKNICGQITIGYKFF